MRGWFQLILDCRPGTDRPTCRESLKKRLIGFEPTTFCMASRRSSQLSYSRMCPLLWPMELPLRSSGGSCGRIAARRAA